MNQFRNSHIQFQNEFPTPEPSRSLMLFMSCSNAPARSRRIHEPAAPQANKVHAPLLLLSTQPSPLGSRFGRL